MFVQLKFAGPIDDFSTKVADLQQEFLQHPSLWLT